jgi:GTPase Era involved in 16S rRNA processing
MDTSDSKTVGLILLGNSGSGKSFLANCLIGKQEFISEFSPTSVTKRTDYRDFDASGVTFRLFDIPGLIEADQAAIETNKQEIQKAFEAAPDSIVAFVFNVAGHGRLKNEDIIAFKAIHKAYEFDPQALLLVINGVNRKCPPTYHGVMITELEDLLPLQSQSVCFLNYIDSDDVEQRKALADCLSEDMNRKCKVAKHSQKQPVVILADEIAKLKKELQDERLQLAKKIAQLQEDVAKQQKEYEVYKASADENIRRLNNERANVRDE